MKLLNLIVDMALMVTASCLALLAIPPGIAAAALITMARNTAFLTSSHHARKNP